MPLPRSTLVLSALATLALLLAGAGGAAAAPRRTKVTLTLPAHAVAGTTVKARGHVGGRHRRGRKVALQRRVGKGYRTLKRGKVARNGGFAVSFRVPAAAAKKASTRAAARAATIPVGAGDYRAVVTDHGQVVGESDPVEVDTRAPTPSLSEPTEPLAPTPSLSEPVEQLAPTPSLTPYQITFEVHDSKYAFDQTLQDQGVKDQQSQDTTLSWKTVYDHVEILAPLTSTVEANGLDQLSGTAQRRRRVTGDGDGDMDQTCNGDQPAEAELQDNPPKVDLVHGSDAQHFNIVAQAFNVAEFVQHCNDGTAGHMYAQSAEDPTSSASEAYDGIATTSYAAVRSLTVGSSIEIPVESSHFVRDQNCKPDDSDFVTSCTSDTEWTGTITIERTG